jgi:phage terminase large subunit-like protein
MVILDELHVWGAAEQELFDALTTGSAARREPLFVYITTAGTDEQSLCYREYEYAKRLLTRQHEDATYLPLIWEIGKEADWTDESLWHRANPSLDVIVRREELRSALTKALAMPSEQSAFRRLHCNQWVNSADVWIPLHEWDACKADFSVEC